ncbi:MAG: hypothetical protein J7J97_05665 [Thermococcus sp.]|nr:hypothetical protein [Thermococcus sp.]
MVKINLGTLIILLFSFVFFPFMYWEGNLTFGVIYLLAILSIAGYLTATAVITVAKLSNIGKLLGYSVILIYALTVCFTRNDDMFYLRVIPLFIGMMYVYISPRRSYGTYSIPLKYLIIILAALYMTVPAMIIYSSGNMPISALIGAFMMGTMWVATNEPTQNKKAGALYFLVAIYAYLMGYYLSKYGSTLEIIIGGLILAGFLFSFFAKGFIDIGLQIFTVGFLFHFHQIVPILITREFQVLALQIIVGSILKATLWITLTVLTTWAVIKITKSRKIQVSSCLNFYPLVYWGVIAILIKTIPYFTNIRLIWPIRTLLSLGTLTAWGISYYLLARNLKEQLKSMRAAVLSALISGTLNFVLLPPPL